MVIHVDFVRRAVVSSERASPVAPFLRDDPAIFFGAIAHANPFADILD